MENNIKTDNQAKDEKILEETYKDDFWSKNYDVTKDELKKGGRISLSAMIIEAGAKRKSFSLE